MQDQTPPARTKSTSHPSRRMQLKRTYPTAADLRRKARRRLPRFAFEYCDGGAGSDGGIRRNWASLDAIEMMPRYGRITSPSPTAVTLFGRSYSAPIGIAPMGGPTVVMPGADHILARAAQHARVPYVLGLMAGTAIERAAELAPDVLWFQLYRCPRNDHALGFDLVRRAEAAGVHALMLTMDTPIRTVRSREVKAGVVNPFRLTARLCLDALSSPSWTTAMLRHGIPRFANLAAYMPPNSGIEAMARFSAEETGGAFTWDEVARYRDRWRKPLLVKGILHPEDAARAVALGLDGIVVSNHGGRQVEGLPAAIDVLPAVVAAAGGRATVIFDSGIRSGGDVARAVAMGADAALSGKAFLWSLGALGAEGPGHLIDLLTDDLAATLGQLGCATVADLRCVHLRHAGAYRPDAIEPVP